MAADTQRMFRIILTIIFFVAGILAGAFGVFESQNALVDVEWQTASSINLVEFRIYRSSPTETTRTLVSSIPISNDVDPYQPHNFSYRDTSAQPGNTYTYHIESISRDGSITQSSPLVIQAASQGTGFFWLAGGLFAAALSTFALFRYFRPSDPGAAA